MIKFIINETTDITDYVVRDSFSKTEQLQNRANTCSFSTYNYKVNENQLVVVWSGGLLAQAVNIGDVDLVLQDTFEYFERFRIGQKIYLDVGGTQEKAVIQNIVHATKTITLEVPIKANYPSNTAIGVKIFAGVVVNAPEEEITLGQGTPTLRYDVQCSDYNNLLDRKNIVDTFLNMYPKELIGRSINKFIASDTTITLDTFASAWTPSGTAFAMVDDFNPENVVEGLASQLASVDTGTGLYEKTITPVDITDCDKIRVFYKVGLANGINVAGIKYRFGNDNTNYYEWTCKYATGLDDEDCYHLEAFTLAEPDVIVGTVDFSLLSYMAIEIQAVNPITAIYFDVIKAVKNGFSCNDVMRGGTKIEEARFQYQKPSVVFNKVAKLSEYFWHVDYDRNIHMYVLDKTPSPYTLTGTSENYADLVIEADASSIKNMQVVRGGEAPDENTYTQEEYGDGVKTSWYLDYKPKDIAVYVDTGSGYTPRTIGVENLVNESSVDYIFNFNEKTLRKANDSVLLSTHKIKFEYYPYKAIRVRLKDQPSINGMKLLTGGDGIYEGAVINDSNIKTWDEARKRAQVEIDTYKNPILTATFTTEKEGLSAGQVIHILDTDRGIDDDFLIQKIGVKQKARDYFVYNVEAGSTLFGMIEFFQLLLNSRNKYGDVIDRAEVVDIVENVDEVITIADGYAFTQNTTPFKVASQTNKILEFVGLQGNITATGYVRDEVGVYGSIYGQGTNTDVYAKIQGSNNVRLITGNYNERKELQVIKGDSNTVEIFTKPFHVKPSITYRIRFWYEIISNGGTGNCTIKLKEYNTAGVQLVEIANTDLLVLDNTETPRQFTMFEATVTANASSEKARIFIETEQDIVVHFADFRVEPINDTETVTNPARVGFSEVA